VADEPKITSGGGSSFTLDAAKLLEGTAFAIRDMFRKRETTPAFTLSTQNAKLIIVRDSEALIKNELTVVFTTAYMRTLQGPFVVAVFAIVPTFEIRQTLSQGKHFYCISWSKSQLSLPTFLVIRVSWVDE
jgi:hypothetical protein